MANLQTEKHRVAGGPSTVNIQTGSRGNDVQYAQFRLKELGYYTGRIDGVFGPITNQAVIDFQTDYKLEADGIIGPITGAKINEIIESDEVFQRGNSDVEIKSLQRQLKVVGHYTAQIDGIFGPITDDAVTGFQQDTDLVVDGKVGPATKSTLRQKLLGEDIIIAAEQSGLDPDKTPVVNEAAGHAYVSAEQLKKLGWANVDDAMLNDLNRCLDRYEITTPERIRHFISQCSHESGLGKWSKEIASGETYEGRRDLGNVQQGDGPRFKGAGYIQLTGRKNYQDFADSVGDPKIMEGVNYVAEKYPWTSAGFWWHNNNMNTICDRGASVKEVTKKVNGGYNGLLEREKYYRLCTEIFK